MEKRRLGRTGHQSTVVTFGAFAIGYVNQDDADRAIQLVLDHGINHIDIAPGYDQAMERLAPWMPSIRDQVFLGSKTRLRTRDDAWRDVEQILQRMNVDNFDLFQLHAVLELDDLNLVMGTGGAIETLLEMRDQGLTRWIGITGHGPSVPATILEGLRRYDFDTVMFPLNATLARNQAYRRASEELLVEASARDVGVQIIKMIARGGWQGKTGDCRTWYDPYREQQDIDRSLWWVLSQPIHSAPSCGEISLLPKVLDAAERFRPLTSEEHKILATKKPSAPLPELAITVEK